MGDLATANFDPGEPTCEHFLQTTAATPALKSTGYLPDIPDLLPGRGFWAS